MRPPPHKGLKFCEIDIFDFSFAWARELKSHRASEQTNELSGARKRSERRGLSKWVSSESEPAFKRMIQFSTRCAVATAINNNNNAQSLHRFTLGHPICYAQFFQAMIPSDNSMVVKRWKKCVVHFAFFLTWRISSNTKTHTRTHTGAHGGSSKTIFCLSILINIWFISNTKSAIFQ